jgi:hypothetical protein
MALLLIGPMPLPIAAEIDTQLALHRQPGNAAHQVAIRDAAVIHSLGLRETSLMTIYLTLAPGLKV